MVLMLLLPNCKLLDSGWVPDDTVICCEWLSPDWVPDSPVCGSLIGSNWMLEDASSASSTICMFDSIS